MAERHVELTLLLGAEFEVEAGHDCLAERKARAGAAVDAELVAGAW